MDPATIIGTASAILSFVQFTGTIISTGIKIRNAASGAIEENQSFKGVLSDFEDRLHELQFKTDNLAANPGSNNDAEESLLQASKGCQELGSRIREALDKTTAKVANEGERHSVRRRISKIISRRPDKDAPQLSSNPTLAEVIRASIQTVWKREEIDRLRDQWETCMVQFNLARSRFEASERHDLVLASFENNSERLSDISGLLETLVERSRSSGLGSLRSVLDNFRNADSDPLLEQRNRKWILSALGFDGMDARRSLVESAAGSTFEWCVSDDSIPDGHPDLEMSFREWLAIGDGVYHIAGKPGSGKSTLMKLIDNAEATDQQLHEWASRDQKQLIRASFYTWKAANASPLQNQIEGLVRTLLHQILTAAPELIPLVFAKHWNPKDCTLLNIMTQTSSTSRPPHLEYEGILKALEYIIQNSDLAKKFCFFFLIDGMDEFGNGHEHFDIARKVQRWSSSSVGNVKTCVSSREEAAFINTFLLQQRLRLHMVTWDDIKTLARERLREHDHFVSASKKDRRALIRKIADKAEGVFLWVVLTIRELSQLLDEQQTFQQLFHVVDSLPDGLEEFFQEIMTRIPRRYYDEAQAIFAIVASFSAIRLACLFSALHFSMVQKVLEDADSTSQSGMREMESREVEDQVEAFNSRLPSMCKGLIVLEPTRSLYPSPLDFEPSRNSVLFIHRSLYDFFRNNPKRLLPAGSAMQMQATDLVLRCVIRVAAALPWERDEVRLTKNWAVFLEFLMSYMMMHDTRNNIHDQGFLHLKTLDMILLRKKNRTISSTEFETFGPLDFSVSAFLTAFPRKYWSYIDWSLAEYPPWISSPRCKAGILEAAMQLLFKRKFEFIDFLSEPLVILLEKRWLSINDIFDLDCTLLSAVTPRLAGPIWLYILVNIVISFSVGRGMINLRSSELVKLLKMGAEPRVRFSWWSEGDTNVDMIDTKGSVLSAFETTMKGSESSDESEADEWSSVPSHVTLGATFGMTIEIGDEAKRHLIQGPQWPSKEDTTIIRWFIKEFGSSSGCKFLREIFAKIPIRNRQNPGLTEEGLVFRRSSDKEDLLRALDEALFRVETQYKSQASDKVPGSHGQDISEDFQVTAAHAAEQRSIAAQDDSLPSASRSIREFRQIAHFIAIPILGLLLAALVGYILGRLGAV